MSDPSQGGKEIGGEGMNAYQQLIAAAQTISERSDIFLPLKEACNVILPLHQTIDGMDVDKSQLTELESMLKLILSIVNGYVGVEGIDVLRPRVELFSKALKLQVDAVEHLCNRPAGFRIDEDSEDADKISKALQTINILCGLLRMDTSMLYSSYSMIDVFKNQETHIFEQLHHAGASYKTRVSSYGDAHGCLAGTRNKILEDLEAWVLDTDEPHVYWLVGPAGIGKSTISHTFCETLDSRNLLGASFFCSRASTKINDARLIVPTIAHALASTSPPLKWYLLGNVNSIETLPEIANGKLEFQFNKLILEPLLECALAEEGMYKIVVIDAIDECANLDVACSLIRFFLRSSYFLPLKLFVTSRDEPAIRALFDAVYTDPSGEEYVAFVVNEMEKYEVKDDIRTYIETSLAEINDPGRGDNPDISKLIQQCGTQFIYAATAIRYIKAPGESPRDRLSALASRLTTQTSQTLLDDLYGLILELACTDMNEDHIEEMGRYLTAIVALQYPLSTQAIASLSETDIHGDLRLLSGLHPVIHVPDQEDVAVTPLHTSFVDFIIDPNRCTPERCPSLSALVAPQAHGFLAHQCLKYMNGSLKYNICEVPEALLVPRMERTNALHDPSKISDVLKYSCLHWATHLSRMQAHQPDAEFYTELCHFMKTSLLHWIQCLSILGELRTGMASLHDAHIACIRFESVNPELQPCRFWVDDARRFLNMAFKAVQRCCMEVYWSPLVWLPMYSPTNAFHAGYVPELVQGRIDTWGHTELVLYNDSIVNSVAFSRDGRHIVSGSDDETVRLWNVMTGEKEAELLPISLIPQRRVLSLEEMQAFSGSKDGLNRVWNTKTGAIEFEVDAEEEAEDVAREVLSVVFSRDDGRVFSSSVDGTIRIWDITSGEIEIKRPIAKVESVSFAFSPDGRRVACGSDDGLVQILNVSTDEIEVTFEGHEDAVASVAFSEDGSRVASGFVDGTVLIWNTITGVLETTLEGHTDSVKAVAFSKDGSRVVSGSEDETVRVWNATTGIPGVRLMDFTGGVCSVTFSQDGRKVAFGTGEGNIWIWNTATHTMVKLAGHSDEVRSVAFSQDGSRLVSGSVDRTVRVWNLTAEILYPVEREDNVAPVQCAAFSPDGSQIVTGSDNSKAHIWNTRTGEVKFVLEGHTGIVWSVAFSHDGRAVVSGSEDHTVRIWDAATGMAAAVYIGHTDRVTSVAFSPDGRRVVSGSKDNTVCIWNPRIGMEAQLKGHDEPVWVVAVSPDSSRIASVSSSEVIHIWNVTTHEMEIKLDSHHADMVDIWSVAFSQDGSRVVSASSNTTNFVRIWNVRTGEIEAELDCFPASFKSVLLTLDESGGVVPQSFDEVIAHMRNTAGTQQRLIGISPRYDWTWLLGTQSDCWIPDRYRGFYPLEFWGSKVCFGMDAGRRLVILDTQVDDMYTNLLQ